MNRIDYDVALELASHEAVVRQAYKDSVGVWTWSIGITSASGHNVERYIGNPQTMQRCLEVYAWALEKYAKDVREAFAGTALTKTQFAAALSFHYNTGAIKRASWVKKFKAGDVAGARKSFMDWRKPAEIIPRREKERDLFFNGKWSNNGTITEYTRVRANGTPDWSSAKRVNVESDLKRALGNDASTNTPKPSQPVGTDPVTSPSPSTGGSSTKAAVAGGFITAALAGMAWAWDQVKELFQWVFS